MFIPLLRSFVSFAAGLAEMAFAKFLVFTVIGCAVWCTALTLLGYSLGSTYDHVQKAFSYATYVVAVLAVVAVAFLIWHRSGRCEGAALSRGTSAGAQEGGALRASEHLERSEAWNGLRAGDPVVVAALSMRGATWEFRAHVAQPQQRHRVRRGGRRTPGRPDHPLVRSRAHLRRRPASVDAERQGRGRAAVPGRGTPAPARLTGRR